jgi:hypothetical protein
MYNTLEGYYWSIRQKTKTATILVILKEVKLHMDDAT